MRSVLSTLVVFSVLALSPAVSTAQSGKGPSKEVCDGLRKAVSTAQTAYNKAHAAFLKAQGDQKAAERSLKSAKDALQKNSDSQEAVQADIDRFTKEAEACQKKNPDNPCSAERNRVFQAKKRLQVLQDARPQLELDVAAAEQWLEKKNADLEAKTAEDASTKQQLEAARAKLAASGCKNFA